MSLQQSDPVEQVSMYRHADGHYSVHTEIMIEASAAEVWAALVDFKAMSTWSSSLKTVAGDIRNGGAVQSHFLAMGKMWVADHVFIYQEGQFYGWSDPLTGDFSGVRDHHLFRVENVSPSLTRFIQSDEFTGEAAAQHGATLARVGFENYLSFNRELSNEVRCRRKAATLE